MKEITGELWSYLNELNHVICITTNGTRKANGDLVMGSGCAKEAKELFPWLPKLLGDQIATHGNQCVLIGPLSDGKGDILSFPTKGHWRDKSDLKLIRKSAEGLKVIAGRHPNLTFVLPRPGCGNGGRTWEEVKPLLIDVLPDNVLVIDNG